MSSRLKSKKWRVVIALVLILIIVIVAAFGYYDYRIQQGKKLSADIPRPPLATSTFSCKQYTKSQGWRTVDCLSQEYVRTHIPHPGLPIVGISPNPPGSSPLFPIGGAVVNVNILTLPGTETESIGGPGGFSVQLNTNTWTGRNGDTYWVQFVHQNLVINLALPDLQHRANFFGIWQIDATVACKGNPQCSNPQGYFCTCMPVDTQTLSSSFSEYVSGNWVASAGLPGPPLLNGYFISFLDTGDPNNPSSYGVTAADLYGLGRPNLGQWQTVSGTILGSGGGSQALFPIGTTVQTILRATYAVPTGIGGYPATTWFTDTTTAESNNLAYPPAWFIFAPQTKHFPDGTTEVSVYSYT